jgi:hypothetical protein
MTFWKGKKKRKSFYSDKHNQNLEAEETLVEQNPHQSKP